MIINSRQEHHSCLLSSLLLWQKVNPPSQTGSWREKFSVRLRHLGTPPESSLQCTTDLSSAYQFISSSYVLKPYLQTGIKIALFTVTFYWSFMFKYQALIQGPSPPAPISAAEHGGTSLQNPAPGVPSSAPALAVLEGWVHSCHDLN